MDLEKICNESCKAIKTVGEYIKEQKNIFSADKIESKGIHDFVSYVDKNSEKQLVAELSKILPEAGFITEEKTINKQGIEYNWIIDPLDGTTNFIHGLPPYAISVALMKNNEEVILGIVYEISLNECFYSWKGGGVFLNGQNIKVTETNEINSSLIATGFPYYDYKYLDGFMESLKYFIKNSHGIRRLGSAATDLAYVACGRFDAFYEYSLHAWDVAAGSFLVKQAGGKVSDFEGNNNFIFGKEIIASNCNIYQSFFNLVSNYLTE